jgi:arsenite methyltransferase
MAELTAGETNADPCCAHEAQASCCEPSAKAECCGNDEGCGCAAGSKPTDVRDRVRKRYVAVAVQVTSTDPGAGCCAPSETFDGGSEVFGAALYALGDHEQLPDTAKLASLGCGNPTAVAELHEGETVLDLGSGGGIDVLLSARRVGPTGKVHGLDMTDEMLALARENARDFASHGIGKLLVPLLVRRQAASEMPENMRRLKQQLDKTWTTARAPQCG